MPYARPWTRSDGGWSSAPAEGELQGGVRVGDCCYRFGPESDARSAADRSARGAGRRREAGGPEGFRHALFWASSPCSTARFHGLFRSSTARTTSVPLSWTHISTRETRKRDCPPTSNLVANSWRGERSGMDLVVARAGGRPGGLHGCLSKECLGSFSARYCGGGHARAAKQHSKLGG